MVEPSSQKLKVRMQKADDLSRSMWHNIQEKFVQLYVSIEIESKF